MGRTHRANPGGHKESQSTCPLTGKIQHYTREAAHRQRLAMLAKPRGRRKRPDGSYLPLSVYQCDTKRGGCGFFHVGHDHVR